MTDEEFLAAFENCTLPFEQWNHCAHVRVAHFYASRQDVKSATDRMRSGVKAYNEANQVPESLDQGYHETVTQGFMRLISEAVAIAGQGSSFEDFKQRWPQFFDKRVLLHFYSRNRIRSVEAKATFVEPDLTPLSAASLDTAHNQLVVFDVDGTLIQSIGIDDQCFCQAVMDVLGVEEISTDWASYKYQTDAGLVFEIGNQHQGSSPTDQMTNRVRDRFLQLLDVESKKADFRLPEIPGAGDVLDLLERHSAWRVAIATGGWERSAKLKLRLASVNTQDIPFASSDDAMARVDIVQCAIERAKQQYHKNEFTKIVYVGDAPWDVLAAQTLGIGFVGVRANRATRPFDENGISVVEDFASPLEFIRVLNSVSTF